ncbi:MAG: VOC family protein [Pseudomonadota bacterium]|nr:VOC family protein [Pseudomonadota bacterium]
MTEPQVTGLRSIEYNVPNLATTSRFYEECWGLKKIEEIDGKHYLRATGPEHHIVVLHEGGKASVNRINFAAPDTETIDGLHNKLSGLGIKTDDKPDHINGPGGGYGFGFADRDGIHYTIASGVATHSDTTMEGDRPFKLSHVVLNSNKVEDQTEFYRDVLGFRVSDRTERMNFIRCSPDHHSVAFAHSEGPSLNHAAFEVPTFDALMCGSGRMKQKGFPVQWGVGRHGPGNNVFGYFFEPNGMVIEYTAEVEQVDEETYQTGTPADWARRVQGPDRWGFADPPSPLLRQCMGGDPQAPEVKNF